MTQAEVDMYTGKDRYVYNRGSYSRSQRVRHFEQRECSYGRFYYERDNTYAGDPHISGGPRRNSFYDDSGFESCPRSNYDARGLYGNADGFFKKRKPASHHDSQLACKRTKRDFKDYQRDSGGKFNNYCQESSSYNGDRFSQAPPQGRSYKYCDENRNACKGGFRGRYMWPRGSRRGREPSRSVAKVYPKESKEVNKDKKLDSHNDEENRKHKYDDRSKDWSRTVKFSSGGPEPPSSANKSPSSSAKTDVGRKLVFKLANGLDCKLKDTAVNDGAASSQLVGSSGSSPRAPLELALKDGQTVTECNSVPQKFLKESNDEDTSKDNSGKGEVPQSDQCDGSTASINNSDRDKLATEAHSVGKSQGNASEGPEPMTGREEATSEFPKTDSVKTTTDAKLDFVLSEETESPKREASESVKKTELVSETDNGDSSKDIQDLTKSKPVSMEIVDTGFEENVPSYSLHIVDDERVDEENCNRRDDLEEVVNFVVGIGGNLEISRSEGKSPAVGVDSVGSGIVNNGLEGAQQNCAPTEDSQCGEKEPVSLKDKAETVISETENQSVLAHLLQNCNEAASKDPPSEVTAEGPQQNTVNDEPATSLRGFRRRKARKNDSGQNASALQALLLEDGNAKLRKASNVRNQNVCLVKKRLTRKVDKNSNLKEKSSQKVPENNLLVVPEKKKKYKILFEELFGKDDDDVVEIFSKVGAAAQVGQCGKKEKEPSAGSKASVGTKLKKATVLEEGKTRSTSRIANKIVPKENLSKNCTDRSTSQDAPPSAASQEGELPWVLKEIELEVIKDPRLSTSKRRKSSDLKIEKIAKRLKRHVSVPNHSTTVSTENKAVKQHPEREVTDRVPPKAKRSLSDGGKVSDCNLNVEKVLPSNIDVENNDYEEGNLVIDLDEGRNKVEDKSNAESININLERSVPNSEGNQSKRLSPKSKVNKVAKISSHGDRNTTAGNLPELGNHRKKLDAGQKETALEERSLLESDVRQKKKLPDFEPPVRTEETSVSTEKLASESAMISEEIDVVDQSLKPNVNTNEDTSHVNKCNETTSSDGNKILDHRQDGKSFEGPSHVNKRNETSSSDGNKNLDHRQDGKSSMSGADNGSVEQSAPKFPNVPTLIDLTTSKNLECENLTSTGTEGSNNTGCNGTLQQGAPGNEVSIDVNKGGTLDKPQMYIRVKDPKTLLINSENNQLQYFNQVREMVLQLFRDAPPQIVLQVRDFCQLTMSVRNDLYQYMIHKQHIINSPMSDPDKSSDLNCAYHCLYFCCEFRAGNIIKILEKLHGYFQSHIQTAILYALEMEGCKTSDAKQVLHFVKIITKFRCCHFSKENCGTGADDPHVILKRIPRQNSYNKWVVLAQLKSKSYQVGGSSNGMFSYLGSIIAKKQSDQPVQKSYNVPSSGHSAVPQGAVVQPDPQFPRTAAVNQYYGQESTLPQSDQLKAAFELAQRNYSGHLNANNPVVRPQSHFPEQPFPHGTISTNPTQSEVLNAPQAGANYLQRPQPPVTLPANPVQSSVPAARPPNIISGTQQNKPVNHLEQLSHVVRAADAQQSTRVSWLPHTAPTDNCRNPQRPAPPPYSYSNLANSGKAPCSVAQLSTSDASSGQPRATVAQHVTPRRYSSDGNAQKSTNLGTSSWNGHLVPQSQHDVISVGGNTQDHNYSQLPRHRPTILRHDTQNSFSSNMPTAAPLSQTNPLIRALIERNQFMARNFHQNRGVTQGQVQQNQLSNHQEHWRMTPRTNITLPVQQTAPAYSSVIHQVRDSHQPSNPVHAQFTPSTKEKLCSPTQSSIPVTYPYHQGRESHQPSTAEGNQLSFQNDPLGHRATAHSQFTPSTNEKLCSPTQSSVPVPYPSYHQYRESHQPSTAEGNRRNYQNEPLGHGAAVHSQFTPSAVHSQFTPSIQEKLCSPTQSSVPVPYPYHQIRESHQPSTAEGRRPSCQNEPLGHGAAVHSQFTPSTQEKLCSPTQSSVPVPYPYHQVPKSHQPSTAEGRRPSCQNEPLGHAAAVHTQFTPSNKEQMRSPTQPVIPVPVISYQVQTGNSSGMQKGPHLMRSLSAEHGVASYAVKDGQPLSMPQLQPIHPTTLVGEQRRRGGPEPSPPYTKPHSWTDQGSSGVAGRVESYTVHHYSGDSSAQQQQAVSYEAQQQSIRQGQFDRNVSHNHPTAANPHNVLPAAGGAEQQREKTSPENRPDAASQRATQQNSKAHQYILPKPAAQQGRQLTHEQHIRTAKPGQGPFTAALSTLQARNISLAKQLGLKAPQGNPPAQPGQATTTSAERRADVTISDYWSSFLRGEATKPNAAATEQVTQVNYKNAEVAQSTLSDQPPAQVGIQSAAQANSQPALVQLQGALPPVLVTVPGKTFHIIPQQLPNLTGEVSTNITSNVPGRNSHPTAAPTAGLSENLVTAENAPPPITVDHVSTTTCTPEPRVSPVTVASVGKKADDVPPVLEKQVDTTTDVHSSSLTVESGAVDEMPALECQEDPLQIAPVEEARPTVLQKQIDTTVTSTPVIIKHGLSKADRTQIVSSEEERTAKLLKVQAKSNTAFPEKDRLQADVPLDTEEDSSAGVCVLSDHNIRPAEKLHPDVSAQSSPNSSAEKANPQSDSTVSDGNCCVVTTSQKTGPPEQPIKPVLNAESCSEVVTSSLADCPSASREEQLERHPVTDSEKQTPPPAAAAQVHDSALNQEQRVSSTQLPVASPVESVPTSGGCPEKLSGPRRSVSSIAELKELIDSGEIVSFSQLKSLLYFTNQSPESGPALPEKENLEDVPACAKRDTVLKGPVNPKTVTVDLSEKDDSSAENVAAEKVFPSDKLSTAQDSFSNLESDQHRAENLPSSAEKSEAPSSLPDKSILNGAPSPVEENAETQSISPLDEDSAKLQKGKPGGCESDVDGDGYLDKRSPSLHEDSVVKVHEGKPDSESDDDDNSCLDKRSPSLNEDSVVKVREGKPDSESDEDDNSCLDKRSPPLDGDSAKVHEGEPDSESDDDDDDICLNKRSPSLDGDSAKVHEGKPDSESGDDDDDICLDKRSPSLDGDSAKAHEGKPDNESDDDDDKNNYSDKSSLSSLSDTDDSNSSWKEEEPSPLEDGAKFRKGEPDCESEEKSNLGKRKNISSPLHPEVTVEAHSNESRGSWVSESDMFVDYTCQTIDDFEAYEEEAQRPRKKVRLLGDEEIDEILNNLERNDASKLSSSAPASPDAEAPTESADENAEMENSAGEDAANAVVNCARPSESISEERKESSEGEDIYPMFGGSPATPLGDGCLQEIFITEEIDIKSEYSDAEERGTFGSRYRNCVCCHGSSDEDDEVTVLDQIIGEYDPDIQIVGIFPKEVEVLRVIKREVDSNDSPFIKREAAAPAGSEDSSGIKREPAASVDSGGSSGIKREAAEPVDCELSDDGVIVLDEEAPKSPPVSSTKSEPVEGTRKSEGHESDSAAGDPALSSYETDEEPAADRCESAETFCAPLIFPGNDKNELGYAVYPENVKCAACPNVAVLLCSGCRITCYCSLNCQHKDWVECHRKECEGGQPEGDSERRGAD